MIRWIAILRVRIFIDILHYKLGLRVTFIRISVEVLDLCIYCQF